MPDRLRPLADSADAEALRASLAEFPMTHQDEIETLRQLGHEVGPPVVAVGRPSFQASVHVVDGELQIVVTDGGPGGSYGPVAGDSADVVGDVQIMAAPLSTVDQRLSWSIDPAPASFEIVVGDGALIALLTVSDARALYTDTTRVLIDASKDGSLVDRYAGGYRSR